MMQISALSILLDTHFYRSCPPLPFAAGAELLPQITISHRNCRVASKEYNGKEWMMTKSFHDKSLSLSFCGVFELTYPFTLQYCAIHCLQCTYCTLLYTIPYALYQYNFVLTTMVVHACL